MAAILTLYDPTARRHVAEVPPQTKMLATLAGAVVGFIDNAKPNFNHLVDDLAELLTARYGVRRVLKKRKRAASVPAPDEVMDEITQNCDLVITGSGD